MPEAKRSRKTEERGGQDRISSLSDDLLIQILLLVPTKDAVSTTFLSKRWRFVWTKLPRLEYKETKDSELETSNKSVWWFLDESMRFHNAPLLETLCIKLGPQCPVSVDVVKWVRKAVDHGGMIELKFRLLWNSEPILMPQSLYTCKRLTRLSLAEQILVDVPSMVSLPSLTQLDLVCVVYKDEDSLIRLLSSCPVLKNLKVFRHNDLDDNVRKFIVKVPSLQSLDYQYILDDDEDDDDDDDDDDNDDDDDQSLVIDTPALKSLYIFDRLGHSCSMEYMPCLGEAYIEVDVDVYYPDENFLRSLSLIKYLQLDPVDTMVPWCNVVYSQLIKCRIFQFHPDWCETLVVLLSNCPKLNFFWVKSIFEIDRSTENPVPVLWDQPSSVPKCLSSHLEIFGWEGYAGREDEKEVVRYILENSKCLKRAVISLISTCNLEEKQKMIEELESMRRVSTSFLSLKGR